MMVITLNDWPRAFYHDISNQINMAADILINSFSVIVVIYVICINRPHQFLQMVGMLCETGPST